jgi:hypothetical protein
MLMQQRVFRVLLMVLFFAGSLIPASRAGAQVPRGDVFFGYSRAGSNLFYPNEPALNGWEATGSVKIGKPFLAAEADVAHYGIGANSEVPRSTTVLVGPQVALRAARFKIFGHFLVGGEHSANNSDNTPISGGSFIYALGAGVDVPIAPFFAWRVQGDRLSSPTSSPGDAVHGRFTTGIVFRF